MTPDPKDLKDLRRILRLKRHETPPPSHWEGFSSQILHRIQEEEARSASRTWWQKLRSLEWIPQPHFLPAHSLNSGSLLIGANALIVLGLGLLSFSVLRHHIRTQPDGLSSDRSAPKSPLYQVLSPQTAGPAFATSFSNPSQSHYPVHYGGPMLLRIDLHPIEIGTSAQPTSPPAPEPSFYPNPSHSLYVIPVSLRD